jgi:hypothetical protein
MTLECEQAKQMAWTQGAGKALKALGDALMKQEYNDADASSETRTDPRLMVVDLNSGSTITLNTTPHSGGKTDGSGYVRYPDYEQSNPNRVPPTLQVSVLLNKMAGMLDGRLMESALNDIAEAMKEANELRLSNDKETYKHWLDEHSSYPTMLKQALERIRSMTVKPQKGDTLISMQAIPHMVATASVSEIEAIVAPFVMEILEEYQ